MPVRVLDGDCQAVLPGLADNSIDACICDPPFGLRFMGARWDYDVPTVAIWRAVLRVVKPGGHLLVFSSTRTYHRTVLAIEDAGWEIRDQLAWVSASNMPKSRNVEAAVAEALVKSGQTEDQAAAAAKRWAGTGTSLKPCWTPICLARRPGSTVAETVLAHGTGGLNIDACRVPIDPLADASQLRVMHRSQRRRDQNGQSWGYSKGGGDQPQVVRQDGRWPGNIAHDGSDEVTTAFAAFAADQASPSRFFYCGRVSQKERAGTAHPTTKPLALMQWLVRLITPPGGTVLDPFAGSGTTGVACVRERCDAVLIEREPRYVQMINTRLAVELQPGSPGSACA